MNDVFFMFENDFVDSGIRCIPMIVRFKLDACGIKLKLAEWSCMSSHERARLASAPCSTLDEIGSYRQVLCSLISLRTGNTATEIPIPENPPWSRMKEIPYIVQSKLQETGASLSLDQWQRLTDLQRFALLKLSSPGHENRNFPKALAEFGFIAS